MNEESGDKKVDQFWEIWENLVLDSLIYIEPVEKLQTMSYGEM